MSDWRITAIRVRSNHRKYRFRLIMMMIFHPYSMHGLMLAQTCMQRCYFTNKNHPTQSCEYLMQRKTKTMWGSPFSQRGPHFTRENGDQGSPFSWGPQNFMTPGPHFPMTPAYSHHRDRPPHSSQRCRARHPLLSLMSLHSSTRLVASPVRGR